jgi:adenosine deaminase
MSMGRAEPVAMPSVVLHDHLDGGLRPQTVLDLAHECGYAGLPAPDAWSLKTWFFEAADSGSLERFLETFAHTVAVLQTPAALERVAAEAVEDLAADGVAWAEIRMAPELCVAGGMSMDEVVTAMLAGLREGERRAAAAGHLIDAGLILCAMRQADRGLEVAHLVRDRLDDGVIGFDIAGPEAGFPASRLREAFDLVRATPARITVHAGEAAGLDSIVDALAMGAERLGHGVRIVDDIAMDDSGNAFLGPIARYVRDRGIALEMCPTSNLQTGTVAAMGAHPFALLQQLGFVVTVNTDNRLMCDTSVSSETHTLMDAFDCDETQARRWAVSAMHAAFAPYETKQRIIARLESAS